jgi:hypothetical protein
MQLVYHLVRRPDAMESVAAIFERRLRKFLNWAGDDLPACLPWVGGP